MRIPNSKLVTTGYHLAYNPELNILARKLRRNMTPAENKLWYGFFRTSKYRFLRQKPIENYIVDFYCPKFKLVIEIDGDSHFEDNGKRYDEKRTSTLKTYGLNLIRFTNIEVIHNFEGVCYIINKFLVERGDKSP